MRRLLILCAALVLAIGGASHPTPPSTHTAAVPPAALPPVERQRVWIIAEPAVPAQGAPVPYSDESLGVSLAYPEGSGEPQHDNQGGLIVPLDSGDLTVYRMAHPPELSPMESISAFIDETVRVGNSRFTVVERGTLRIGGYDAAYVQATFPSAAGRWDRVFIIVPIDSIEYRLSCGTKQGPPVTPWEQVQPVCRQVLKTLQLEPFPATAQPLSLRFRDGDHGWVGASLRGCEDHPQARCSGAVWTTADAGAHWDRRYFGPVIPLALDATDTAVWVAGGPVQPQQWLPNSRSGPGVLLRSEDGGRTWASAFASPDSPFRYIHFVDGRHGWLGSAEGLWRTEDAGQTWHAVNTPRCSAAPPSEGCFFSFWSATDGVALSAGNTVVAIRDGQLTATVDGGQTWRTMDLPSLSGKANP